MKERKTIKLSSNIPKAIILGLILGFLTLLIVEHFGNFSYIADTSGLPDRDSQGRILLSVPVTGTTPVSNIYYDSPLDTRLYISGSGWQVSDVAWADGDFYKYGNKLKYYLEAFTKDIKYAFLFGLGYAILILFFMNFKIKFS